ncbi:hypothetical protein INT43_007425 [Umbelopsis isabellina]|uniref:Mitochondrial resolvase Ydc2 catalytic domain-containing protein n=1 Tax=Mortierella isabellina TaxID=91625 RepID=A0A8H7PZY4_MORIS|nr:hypothetical protein INT43_007425 [Umbelopsis isabellina]
MRIIPHRHYMFLSKCRVQPLASTLVVPIANKRFLYRNAVLKELRSRLEVNKASQLKMEAALTGVAVSGTKKELIERIVLHYDTVLLDDTVTKTYTAVPESVISIDMGYRNLAFAHVSREQKVLRWCRVDLDIDNHHPSQSASTVTRFVRDQLLKGIPPSSTDCAIVIEKQRFRSMGGFSVLEHTLRVNMVEAMLWSALQCMTDPNMIKEAVSPVAVEKYWSDIKGYCSDDNQLSSKKKRSELLVAKLLSSNYIDCNPELLNMFASEKKKDDLSDSMLQGLAWLDWRKYTQKNIQEIL